MAGGEPRLGGKKVLFTTFTSNLALDIEQNLRTLCSARHVAKLEVKNLDAWVNGFMRSRKLEHRIVYDRKQDGALQAWQAALATKDATLDLPDNFYEMSSSRWCLRKASPRWTSTGRPAGLDAA
jgi:hypothetical protein